MKAVFGTLPLRSWAQKATGDDLPPPETRHVRVVVPGLDHRLDGLRIGQLSDVHVGATLTTQFLADTVARWKKRPPDILAVTGDLLDDADAAPACMDILSTVKAPWGRFYSLGNHENFSGREEIVRAARAAPGMQLLVGECSLVKVDGAVMHVSGVDYPVGQSATAARDEANAACVAAATTHCEDADFRLCLSHHPDDFDEIAARRVELTLSGHTHGGQVAPLGTWMINRLFKYPRGHYQQGKSHLYVSAGTGGSFPYRSGMPAEVTEITLHRA